MARYSKQMLSAISGAVALLLAIHIPVSVASPLISGVFAGQPQITVKEGKTIGCGIRVIGFSKVSSPNDFVSGFDVSFVIYANGQTLFKGLAIKPSAMNARLNPGFKISYTPIKSFWLKSPGKQAATALNQKFIPGETKNSLLYVADFELAVGLLETVMIGEELKVSIHRLDDPIDQVFYGVVSMSDEEVSQVSKCLEEIST